MSAIAHNLIPTPISAAQGWTGGTFSTDYSFTGGYSLRMDATTSVPEVTAPTTETIPLDPTHTYYARVYAYQPAQIGTVGFYWPIAEPNFGDGLPVGPAGQWNLYSVINTRQTFSAGSYQLRLDFNNSNVAGITYFDGCMLIDLTADFGAGNEPTKDWCDTNIPYFISSALVGARLITLTNIIPNSSFEEDASWNSIVYDTTEKLDGNRSSKLGAGTTVTTTGQVATPIVGHKYYGRSYIKSQGDISPADCRFEWYAGDGYGLNFVFAYNLGNFPDWTMRSSIVTVDAVTGTSYIIRNFVVDAQNPCWTDCLMIIDLTAAFGAGQEPDITWCDRNILYFTGTTTILVYGSNMTSITGASISPNPATAGQTFTLSVNVTEIDSLLLPEYFYSGELYAQEE